MDCFFQAISDNSACCDNIEILLVVRNPRDIVYSAYQQAVKYDGLFSTFEEHLSAHNFLCGHTVTAAKLISRLREYGIQFKLFNYSHCGYNIVGDISTHIGIDQHYSPGDFCRAVVNRSLSYAELQVVLLANQLYGRDEGRCLANALINEVPDVKSFRPTINRSSAKKLADNMKPFLDIINSNLPDNQPLFIDPNENNEDNYSMQLTLQQAEIIREHLKLFNTMDASH